MNKQKADLKQRTFGFPDEELKTSFHDEIVLWIKDNAAWICGKLIGWTEAWDPEMIECCRKRAAATVAERVDLLREALAKEKPKLQSFSRTEFCRDAREHLEKRINAMEAELTVLDRWEGLGDPPPPRLDVHCVLEKPIERTRYETTDIMGYADAVLSVRASRVSAGIAPSDNYGEPHLGVDAQRYAAWVTEWTDLRRFAFDAKKDIRSLGQLLRQFKTYQAYSRWPFYAVSPDSRYANEISDEGFGFIRYPDARITFPKRSSCH